MDRLTQKYRNTSGYYFPGTGLDDGIINQLLGDIDEHETAKIINQALQRLSDYEDIGTVEQFRELMMGRNRCHPQKGEGGHDGKG